VKTFKKNSRVFVPLEAALRGSNRLEVREILPVDFEITAGQYVELTVRVLEEPA